MFDYALKKFFFTDVANLQSHTIRVVITRHYCITQYGWSSLESRRQKCRPCCSIFKPVRYICSHYETMKVCQLKITKFVSGNGSTTWIVLKTWNHSGWLWWQPFPTAYKSGMSGNVPTPTSNTPIRYWSNDPIKQKMALLLPSLKALSQVNNTVRRQSLSCRHHNVWCLDTFALLSLANV